MKPFLAQSRAEIQLALTQGESLLVTVGIPVILLVAFTTIKVLPLPHGVTSRTSFLVPGTLALAIMATGLVSQGISTAVDRTYGVLKRLGITPLGKAGMLAAKIAAIFAVEVIQIAVISIVGLLLGWTPKGNVGLFLVAALLASVAFTGLGLLLAGVLRSEAMISISNGIYLILLLIGGMIIPVTSLPSFLQEIAKATPALATSQIFFHSLGVGGSAPALNWIVLSLWAVGAPLLAVRFFHWE